MSSIKLNLDTSVLTSMLKEFTKEIEKDISKGVKMLADQTTEFVLKSAEGELSKQTFEKFKKSLTQESVSPGLHVISIDEKALWIEEGLPAGFDMKPGMLDSPKAKTSAAGAKYMSIPFDKGKSKTASTGYEFNLRERVKSELNKAGVPFKKIEKDAHGKAIAGKVGEPKLLHRFDFGGEIPGKGNTPVLQGVSIYQTMTKTGNVRRDIMTFRTVSGGPASNGKWLHPGRDAKNFLDKAKDYAEKIWETEIVPGILDKYKK